MDLCGVDYSAYGDNPRESQKYAVVVHLLLVSLNQRVRVRCFAVDDEFPVVYSLVDVWPGINGSNANVLICLKVTSFAPHSD